MPTLRLALVNTFEKARDSVLQHLATVIAFCSQLNQWYPNLGFDKHVRTLTGIQNKLKGAIGPCITTVELERIEELRQHLMNHPDLKPQLTQFGKLADVAAKALVTDMS